MAENPVNVLSLCSGIGGLELGLRMALPAARVVCYVEREAYACEVLAARIEEGYLDDAPVWTDLNTFDGAPWRGLVDIVIAGYPCQPFSCAGTQKGAMDPRHLWPEIARIIHIVRPSLCFFENVPNHLNIGFREVCKDLYRLGYGVEAGIFSAEEVGAPHLRRRLFILAYTAGARFWSRERKESGEVWDETRRSEPDRRCDEVAHTQYGERGERLNYERRQEGEGARDGSEGLAYTKSLQFQRITPAGADEPRCSSKELAHSNEPRLEGERRIGLLNGERETQRDDPDRCCNEELDDAGRERQQGRESGTEGCRRGSLAWPPGPDGDWSKVQEDLKPAICRVADGIPNRVDRLRCLGNAVIPIVAAKAFITLARRARL